MSVVGARTEVFLRDDIASILRAIEASNRVLARHLPTHEVALYRAGFEAALQAIALAFDVPLEGVSEEPPDAPGGWGEPVLEARALPAREVEAEPPPKARSRSRLRAGQ